jgi:hypothetical protein
MVAQSGVYSWGRGRGLGVDERYSDQLNPRPLIKLSDVQVSQVACGDNHTLALSNNHYVYSWGLGQSGRLGHGSCDSLAFPTRIVGLHAHAISKITCGHHHSLAVTMGGTLFAWGANNGGQLGIASMVDQLTPHPVRLPSQAGAVLEVAGGAFHTLAITEGGACYSWGLNNFGQLGLTGGLMRVLTPQKIEFDVLQPPESPAPTSPDAAASPRGVGARAAGAAAASSGSSEKAKEAEESKSKIMYCCSCCFLFCTRCFVLFFIYVCCDAIYIYIYIYIYMCVCVCVCVYFCICMCVYVSLSFCSFSRLHPIIATASTSPLCVAQATGSLRCPSKSLPARPSTSRCPRRSCPPLTARPRASASLPRPRGAQPWPGPEGWGASWWGKGRGYSMLRPTSTMTWR